MRRHSLNWSRPRVAVALLLTLAVGHRLDAATFTVPSAGYPTLQSAIDAAAAGDLILVSGTHDPVTIDKPLRIVGNPTAVIDSEADQVGQPGDCYNGLGSNRDNVWLSGAGGGTVLLSGIRLQGRACAVSSGSGQRRVAGGGFDRLELHHCELVGVEWYEADDFTVLNPPGSGIDTSVPLVIVDSSTVEGGSQISGFVLVAPPFDAGVGIRAPGSTVVVLDSTVTGGGVGTQVYFNNCPSDVTGLSEGGAGVVATRVFRANSTIEGGHGATVVCAQTGSTVGVTSAGADVVASEVFDLGNDLTATGPLQLGQTWSMSWSSLGDPTVLVMGSPRAPEYLGPYGWNFVDFTPSVSSPQPIFLLVPGGSQTWVTTVPNLPNLLGISLSFELYDGVLGRISRPVVTTGVP